jgi:hypothetical protein
MEVNWVNVVIAQVTFKAPPANWFELGGLEDLDSVAAEDDGKTYFYQKWYAEWM